MTALKIENARAELRRALGNYTRGAGLLEEVVAAVEKLVLALLSSAPYGTDPTWPGQGGGND